MKGNVVVQRVVKDLTCRQEQAIAALLAHGSIVQAAKAVGVTEVTLWRWQQQPVFRKRYREARFTVVERAIALAQQLGLEAVQVCERIMMDGSVPTFARLTAVGHIKDLMIRGTELLDLETRITELEASVEKTTKQQRFVSFNKRA